MTQNVSHVSQNTCRRNTRFKQKQQVNSFGNRPIENRLLKLTFSIRIQCKIHKLPLLDFSFEHIKTKIDIVDIYFNTLHHIYLLAMINTLEIIV